MGMCGGLERSQGRGCIARAASGAARSSKCLVPLMVVRLYSRYRRDAVEQVQRGLRARGHSTNAYAVSMTAEAVLAAASRVSAAAARRPRSARPLAPTSECIWTHGRFFSGPGWPVPQLSRSHGMMKALASTSTQVLALHFRR